MAERPEPALRAATSSTALIALVVLAAPLRAQLAPDGVAVRHEALLRSEVARVYAPSAYAGHWALRGRYTIAGTVAHVARDRLVLVGEAGRCTLAPMPWVCGELAGLTCEGEPGYACLPSPLDTEHHVTNGTIAFDDGTLDLTLAGSTVRPSAADATAALDVPPYLDLAAHRVGGFVDHGDGSSTITLRSATAWEAAGPPHDRWPTAVNSALGPRGFADADWTQEVLVLEWRFRVDAEGHVTVSSRRTVASGSHACRGLYRRRSPPYDDCNGAGPCRCVPLDGAPTLVDW